MKLLVLVANDFLYPALVSGIKKTPKKRNNESARPAAHEVANLFAHVILVERPDNCAARIHSFLHAPDHVATDERLRLFLDRTVAALLHARPVNPLRAATNQNHVLVPFRRDQPETWPLLLDDPV